MALTNRPKVTIKDVARACGVSTQTVSRVLNNRVDVSQDTREKILAVMEQMEYQPSALARSMRQRTNTFGVIIAGLKYIGISTTLNGITQAAEARGFSLILKELPAFDSMEMVPFLQSLAAFQVQGIIYAAPEVGENWKIAQSNLNDQMPPVIYLKGNPTSAPLTISFDNYSSAYTITRHLIDQGYRNIGHISGPQEWWESRERKRGWMRALTDAGLPVSEDAAVTGNWSSSSGAASFDTLLTRYPQLDAVFVSNDQMSLGVLNRAWEKGLDVPNQLGVAGFDDISESGYFNPPLTTIHQDFERLGELAVRKLVTLYDPKSIDTEVSGDSLLLPTTLKVRQSTLRKRS